MRFFDRTEEIASLREIRRMSKDNAQFTVVTGRRRIGKTYLVWKAYEDEPILYFFVARKAEGDLCEDYRLEIESKLGIPTMGRAEHFADVFEFLMKLSTERPITLFIDEFQEFFRVNKSVYSDMQRIWDIYSPKARMNLVVCGSIYSMMTKIFKDKKEPLYNRQTRFMTVRPFTPAVLKEILTEYHPGHTAEDLLALYSFTGGVAKYVQLLVDAGATTKSAMLDHIIKADSIFQGYPYRGVRQGLRGIFLDSVSHSERQDLPFGNRERSRQGNRRLPDQAGKRVRGHRQEAAPLREEFHQECPLYDRGQLLHVLVPLHLQVQLYAGDRELREREDDYQQGLRDVQRPDARMLFQACADRTPSLHTHRRMVGPQGRE